jgi:hypothetical protein
MMARSNPLISIVERGDSYRPLVELMGGRVIEVDLEGSETLNPWDLPPGDISPTKDKIAFLKNLTRHMIGDLGQADTSLLDNILYVDLCNEFPLDVWAPFTPKGLLRGSPEGVRWMADSIAVVREAYPDLAYTFSFTSEYGTWQKQDVSMLDFLELHLWMVQLSDFYKQVGYNYERFESKGYENLAESGERIFRSKPEYWNKCLSDGIRSLPVDWSKASGKPLITTECWSVVDYKDWPLLNWDWIKDLCETGIRTAAGTGRWAAMATSNFCGPQFRGMWRDVAWHRRMTQVIRSARIA